MKFLFTLLVLFQCSLNVNAEDFCAAGVESIPDGNGSVTWLLSIPEMSSITTDVSLNANITHPWVGDLSIRLTAPNGATSLLLHRPGMPSSSWVGPWGCGGDDLVCQFTDSASVPAEDSCSLDSVPVLNGDLLPLESFNKFVGMNPSGQWSLEITDHSFIDSGSINTLCLVLLLADDCNENNVSDSDDISGGFSTDINLNGIPDECECLGDFNNDDSVNVEDILNIINEWGPCEGCFADINLDGVVDISDLLFVVATWGPCE